MIIRCSHYARPVMFGLAGILLFGLAALPASAQTVAEFLKQSTPSSDPVIARVNSTEIRRSDLASALNTMPPQVQQMQMGQIYPLLIDRMVDVKLLAAAGRAAGLANDP